MPPEQVGNPLLSNNMIPMMLIMVAMYFILIRPEKKKQDDRKKQVESLKKNDHVVTVGGVHGTVINVKETTIIVRIDDNVKVEVDKEAVSLVKTK